MAKTKQKIKRKILPKGNTKRVKAGTNKAAAAQRKVNFAMAYIANGGNKYQAAIEAGFKPGAGAEKAATRMSEDVGVKALIAEATENAAKIAGLNIERTLREIARLAYSDPRRLYKPDGSLIPVYELDDDAAATVASIEVDEIGTAGKVIGYTKKIKHWDKNAALEKAMKYHGLYEKDNEQTGRTVVMAGPDYEKMRAELAAKHGTSGRSPRA